jgi:hypothetical protein
MEKERIEIIRERVISLIESEYESDASFERAVGLPEKTVNNWRRGRSASFMKMMPTLASCFSVNVGELLDMPLTRDTSELSDEELKLLRLYRKSRTLPEKMRTALRETIETTINLYILTANEAKPKSASKKK